MSHRRVVGVGVVSVELLVVGLILLDRLVVQLRWIGQHVVRAIQQTADGVGELRSETGKSARAAGQTATEFTE